VHGLPTLFDLIDESKTMEVDGVAKQDYWKVVDRCYLCDMCYMTKCPYVPPHQWNVDFPHLMLRAKAVKFRKGGASFRDKLLSSTDALGKLATIPVVVQFVNAVNKNGVARGIMDSMLGVHKDRVLPDYDSAKFRSTARPNASFPAKDGEKTPGKVAIFSTCYVNYNEPGIGHDLLKSSHTTRCRLPWWKKKPVAACPSSSWAISKRLRATRKSTFRCWPGWRAKATRS